MSLEEFHGQFPEIPGAGLPEDFYRPFRLDPGIVVPDVRRDLAGETRARLGDPAAGTHDVETLRGPHRVDGRKSVREMLASEILV